MNHIYETVAGPTGVIAFLAAAIMLAICVRRRFRSARSMLVRYGFATFVVFGLLFVTVYGGPGAASASFNFHLMSPGFELKVKPGAASRSVADASTPAEAPSRLVN